MATSDDGSRADAVHGRQVRPRIGLALSGGGTRAAAFHLGVLSRLAEDCRLEDVSIVSTVSGGSLVVAAVLSASGMRWPTSSAFLDRILPQMKDLLTEGDLLSFAGLGWSGLARHNLSIITDRAGILADRLASQWGVVGRLADLPDLPVWTINATCIETGKNWRFSKREMGDWSFGRHYSPPFGIAQAAAASAAVPYGIGALRFRLPSQGWMRTDPATREPLEAKSPPSETDHLWDGGAYENLGLEAIFKPGEPLRGCDYLVCSDASGPLGPPRGFVGPLLGGDLWSPRLFDVASDQIRALRSRMLMREYTAGRTEGVLVRMGNSTRDIDIAKRHRREPAAYDSFLTDADCRNALAYPTNLKAMTARTFDMLVRHGRENADITLAHHGGASMYRS